MVEEYFESDQKITRSMRVPARALPESWSGDAMAAPELLTACCDVGTLDVRFEGDGEHGRDCTSGNGSQGTKAAAATRREVADRSKEIGALESGEGW